MSVPKLRLPSTMDSAIGSLPELCAPVPNLQEDVQFRRLLQSCHRLSEALNNDSRGDHGQDSQAPFDIQAAKLKHVR
jgi:hypothetical protein